MCALLLRALKCWKAKRLLLRINIIANWPFNFFCYFFQQWGKNTFKDELKTYNGDEILINIESWKKLGKAWLWYNIYRQQPSRKPGWSETMDLCSHHNMPWKMSVKAPEQTFWQFPPLWVEVFNLYRARSVDGEDYLFYLSSLLLSPSLILTFDPVREPPVIQLQHQIMMKVK